MEREIVLDTETTGLDPHQNHRIIEIGCVELLNRIPTGNNFHKYINPERDVPADSYAIHGIHFDFLQDKPKFIEIIDEFIDFISDSKLVIHNADFDIRFLNHHLKLHGRPLIDMKRVFCTLLHARKKYPGQHNSLDALCKKFNVDLSRRVKHGALLDCELLAEVYLELMGGKQNVIDLKQEIEIKTNEDDKPAFTKFISRNFAIPEAEVVIHKEFLAKMPNMLWNKIAAKNEN